MGAVERGYGFWKWRSGQGWELWVHWSCALMAAGIGYLYARSYARVDRSFAPLGRWFVAGLGGLIPLASMALHEIGHLLAGRHLGLDPKAIVLTPFAAGTVVPKDAPAPEREAAFALAGPSASIAAAGLAAGTALLLPAGPLRSTARLAATMNLALGLSNLVPSLPLGGGLVTRALRWRATGDRARATRESEALGQATGVVLVALGLSRPRNPFAIALVMAGLTALLGAYVARRAGPDPFGVLAEPR